MQCYFYFTEKTKGWIIVNSLSYCWTGRAQNIYSSVSYSSTVPLFLNMAEKNMFSDKAKDIPSL